MTKSTEAKEVKIIKAEKAGEWVLPIKVDGSVIYALQVNKTKEDKPEENGTKAKGKEKLPRKGVRKQLLPKEGSV